MSKKIKFKKEYFNPLYFIIRELLKRGVSEFYVYGGKSSSKSYTICQLIAIRTFIDECNALIFRKQTNIIKTSIKKTLLQSIESARLSPGFKEMEYEFRTIKGNQIVLKGLDSEEKAKGVEGFSYLLWDELNHFENHEYSQMLLSFRGKIAKAFFGTWNPVSSKSWVKTNVIDIEEWSECDLKLPSESSFVKLNADKTKCLIKTTYLDNYWTVGSPCGTYGYRDEKLLAKYENLRINNFYKYAIEVLGEWGEPQVDEPFFQDFSQDNVGSVEYDPSREVYMSFDFNKYSTCIVVQHYDYYEDVSHLGLQNGIGAIAVVAEYQFDSVGSEKFKTNAAKVFDLYKKNKIFVTGDRSGKQEGAGKQAAYFLLEEALMKICGLPRHELYYKFEGTEGTNQVHELSRIWCNTTITDLKGNLTINAKCSNLISEMRRAEVNEFGKLDKKAMESAKPRWGDYQDCFRHYIQTGQRIRFSNRAF